MSHVILFLCVANSARSQMAEALARALDDGDLEVHSAGSEPSVVNPLAQKVLAERGIATTGQLAKGIDQVPLDRIHTVITLCQEEICPILPEAARHLHWPMPDPAAVTGTEEERLDSFREVRDKIEARLRDWLSSGDRNTAIA